MPAAVGVLVVASLLAPFAPVYDPWAWLVWGRELAGFDLDTSGGPVVEAPAGVGGGGAGRRRGCRPGALARHRPGRLAAALALAYRVAWRLMFPVRVATGLAVRFAPSGCASPATSPARSRRSAVLLLFDPFTSWTRQFAGGLSEPLLVALVLAAIDRGLSERHGQALALGFAAALLRPEAWPLVGAYGCDAWRREPRLRGPLIAARSRCRCSGWCPIWSAPATRLTGAERARGATGAPLHEASRIGGTLAGDAAGGALGRRRDHGHNGPAPPRARDARARRRGGRLVR